MESSLQARYTHRYTFCYTPYYLQYYMLEPLRLPLYAARMTNSGKDAIQSLHAGGSQW